VRAVVVSLVLLGCAATSEGDAGPEVHGSLTTRYRLREGEGDDQDQDLFAVAAIETGDLEEQGWHGSLLARVNRDLDGSDTTTFDDLSDVEGHQTDADIYHAWVDLDVGERLAPLRLGRQLLLGAPELPWFDGFSLATRPHGRRGWTFGAYGGVPFHLFASRAGDLAAGAWVAGRPWDGGRARLDVMRLEDEVTLGSRQDDLIGLDLRHRASEEVFLDGRASWLEGDAREARGGVAWMPEGWTLRLRHTELFEAQRAHTLEADPFFDTLRTLYPYSQTQAVLVRDLDPILFECGGEMRRVEDAADVGEFNRDFDRSWIAVTLPEMGVEDLALTVSADRWVSDTNETEGLGFDLVKQLGHSQASLGTARSLYKVDLFFDQEDVDVRTWYMRWRRRPEDGLDLDLRYEYERASGEDIHGLRMVVTWRF
jgi:hypothetical protein